MLIKSWDANVIIDFHLEDRDLVAIREKNFKFFSEKSLILKIFTNRLARFANPVVFWCLYKISSFIRGKNVTKCWFFGVAFNNAHYALSHRILKFAFLIILWVDVRIMT